MTVPDQERHYSLLDGPRRRGPESRTEREVRGVSHIGGGTEEGEVRCTGSEGLVMVELQRIEAKKDGGEGPRVEVESGSSRAPT